MVETNATPVPERRVLILDDERALLPLLERFLKKQGFAPAAFEDVEPAIEAFRTSNPPFDLLMADLTLKDEASGEDVALQLLAESPRLRVLLMSGYPYSVENLPEGDRARVGFLQKPFLPSQIAEAVRAICPPDPEPPPAPVDEAIPAPSEAASSESPADDPQSSPQTQTTADDAPTPEPHPDPASV